MGVCRWLASGWLFSNLHGLLAVLNSFFGLSFVNTNAAGREADIGNVFGLSESISTIFLKYHGDTWAILYSQV
jgi:hypothetical protein